MKKILLLIILVTCGVANAQQDAWVYFTDKPGAAFYLANPLEMLTQKALNRRAAQNIALDDKDVPINQNYIDGVINAGGIQVMAKSKWLNALHVRGSQSNISALTTLDFVQSIDFASNTIADVNLRPAAPHKISETAKTADTQANFAYGQSSTQVQMLNGHLLHQDNYTGTGMTIAVLDAGFPGVDTAFPFQRLHDNNLILGGYNYVNQNDNFYSGGDHGTTVLSTMGGYVEDQLVGSAPDAFYYLFVTEDVFGENPVEESYWVEAAEAADSLGVDVINTSLGYFAYDNPNYSYSYSDMDGQTAFISRGMNVAFSRGMICVTSAGNSGGTGEPHIAAPGDAPGSFTIGAVNNTEQITGFSSIGPSFDGRIKPDVMAMGQNAVISTTGGTISTANGTSFSSPITAGLVACFWQAVPNKTNAQIVQLIKESADRYNNPDNQYGYGVPDFAQALALQIPNVVKPPFVLYPNPSQNLVNVVFPDAAVQNATVTLFNNLGQVVWEQIVTAAKPDFSIQNLAEGIYSYRITAVNQTQSGRLIKE